MTRPGTFTEDVRQELAGAPIDRDTAVSELACLLRLGGRYHRVGTAAGSMTTLELQSGSGATIRRTARLLGTVTDIRPRLWVREASGVRTATYGLGLTEEVPELGRRLGLLDADGRPVPGLPGPVTPMVLARAALLTITVLSAPGRPVHVELRPPSEESGQAIRVVLATIGVHPAPDPGRDRLVLKSGTELVALLLAAGAPTAAARLEERRRRRQLRNEATRLANADAANLRRSVEAAQAQLQAIERAVARVGWVGLGEELRSLALARMVNPDASLTELGALCEPAVSKSAVHRRMRRIEAIAAGTAEAPPTTTDD